MPRELAWLLAGFLASWIMHGGGCGVGNDIVVGVIGAFIGGWVSGLLGRGGFYGLIGSIVIACIGACLLLALVRVLAGRRRTWRLWDVSMARAAWQIPATPEPVRFHEGPMDIPCRQLAQSWPGGC